jgi:hypothetical protein
MPSLRSHIGRCSALLISTLALAALTAPTVARAADNVTVATGKDGAGNVVAIIVTGSANADNDIAVKVNAQTSTYVVHHDGHDEDTGVQASTGIAITVNTGPGPDRIDLDSTLTGKYLSLVVHGEDGDDTITDDGIRSPGFQGFGDAGNDELTSRDGFMQASGGDGNDTLTVDENGDSGSGASSVSGDGGDDRLEILPRDGASDTCTVAPGPVAAHLTVRCVYSQLGAPAVQTDATAIEGLSLEGAFEADTFVGSNGLAPLLPDGMVLDGGIGGPPAAMTR